MNTRCVVPVSGWLLGFPKRRTRSTMHTIPWFLGGYARISSNRNPVSSSGKCDASDSGKALFRKAMDVCGRGLCTTSVWGVA